MVKFAKVPKYSNIFLNFRGNCAFLRSILRFSIFLCFELSNSFELLLWVGVSTIQQYVQRMFFLHRFLVFVFLSNCSVSAYSGLRSFLASLPFSNFHSLSSRSGTFLVFLLPAIFTLYFFSRIYLLDLSTNLNRFSSFPQMSLYRLQIAQIIHFFADKNRVH